MRAELNPNHPSIKKRAHGIGRADPREGLTREQVDQICETYRTSHLTVRDVARHCKISQDRMIRITRLEKCPPRGRDWALKRPGAGRTKGHVFGGMAPLGLPKPDSAALELAKTALRKRGMVVFNATVDGSGGAGMVKCDGRLFTAQQIIQKAAQ